MCDLLYAAFKQIKMDGWTKKIDNCGSTERNSGSGRPRSLRTADNVSVIQDMICSQDDAPCSHINPCKIQEHIEHCNLAWILFIKRITVTYVAADGPLTSINQTCASILTAVYVLQGRAVTEYRWGGNRNIHFMRHKFLVLTVKKLLKSVYIYAKLKLGYHFFGPPGMCIYMQCDCHYSLLKTTWLEFLTVLYVILRSQHRTAIATAYDLL